MSVKDSPVASQRSRVSGADRALLRLAAGAPPEDGTGQRPGTGQPPAGQPTAGQPTASLSPAGQIRSRVTAAGVRALARCTPYLESELLGLAELAGPGAICVDVGAAAGLYTVTLSQLVGPAGQVHSVEPLPSARPVWSRLLAAGSAGNVRPHAMALGAEPGTGVLSVPFGRYGPVSGRSFLTRGSHGLGSNAEFAGHVEVPVTVGTLDGLCAAARLPRLDFVKIDIEGAELQVLHGGEQVIDEFRPALLVEIEERHLARYGCSPGDVAGWLTRRGYQMYCWRHGWQPAGEIRTAVRNYLFCPPGAWPEGRR